NFYFDTIRKHYDGTHFYYLFLVFYRGYELLLKEYNLDKDFYFDGSKKPDVIQHKMLKESSQHTLSNSKIDEEKIWFKVGLLFATGEIDTHLDKKGLLIESAMATAIALGDKRYNKYI